MSQPFHFVMISAMYENGGNVTHRFLDGHPQMYVYPFESQLGTRLAQDSLSSMFPLKYRWPAFALHDSPAKDYRAIIDEECKVRAKTPQVSKFRHAEFDFSDDDRLAAYERLVAASGRSRGGNVAAFFRATFEAWKNFKRSGLESVYVGYSPVIVIDADKILDDLPGAHVLHVVRNPWSGYADTKKRPVPLSLRDYMLCWIMNQQQAVFFKSKYPDRMHIVRTEDTLADPFGTLGVFCRKIGLEAPETLKTTTWNGEALKEVYPWGTIRKPTPEANLATAKELSEAERAEIRLMAGPYLDTFGYKTFL